MITMGNTSDKMKRSKKVLKKSKIETKKPDKEQETSEITKTDNQPINAFLTYCTSDAIPQLENIPASNKNISGPRERTKTQANKLLGNLNTIKQYLPTNVEYTTAGGRNLTNSLITMCEWVAGKKKATGTVMSPASVVPFYCFILLGSYCSAILWNARNPETESKAIQSKFQILQNMIGPDKRSMTWKSEANGETYRVKISTKNRTLTVKIETKANYEKRKTEKKLQKAEEARKRDEEDKKIAEKTARLTKPTKLWGV